MQTDIFRVGMVESGTSMAVFHLFPSFQGTDIGHEVVTSLEFGATKPKAFQCQVRFGFGCNQSYKFWRLLPLDVAKKTLNFVLNGFSGYCREVQLRSVNIKIMKNLVLLFSLIVATVMTAIGQNNPFTVEIEPISVPNLGGLQSFAFGQADGKWLILGGRLDGLHRRQPFASFDVNGHNNQLIVVDPVGLQSWTAPLTSLSTPLQEQLSSTNMEFQQTGGMLYIIGGYGYSNTAADHITYPSLVAVDVAAVIQAVINGNPFAAEFRQLTDQQFAVTGGHLDMVYDTYYLVGGQRFDGRYNPMGNPTYTQTYTNAVRKFRINDDGTNLSVTHLPGHTDANNLHRRDYNVASQILPNGQEGLTAFSGVFQVGADLPYLNSVNIDSTSYAVNANFNQYYNHYHCAVLPAYSATDNEMHTVFFGGIAQYFDSLGTLVRDDNCPFVKTIARVTRDANGTMAEYKLPVEMPALLGASSEFIPVLGLSRYNNDVLKLDSLPTGRTLVGYIYGGIASPDPNIFWVNDGTQSSASSQIFEVYVNKTGTTDADALNNHSLDALGMRVFPNPTLGKSTVQFDLSSAETAKLRISDTHGKLLFSTEAPFEAGPQAWPIDFTTLRRAAGYFVTLTVGERQVTQKVVLVR